ncbi:PAS domain S-box-containing protein [Methanomicrobium sp. W14]|uniref:sensor histidine kinase n=1 Tax=Methanomicrobium sp. W14 TaxID=2817839 RepID=UPI001AE88F72|nr:histidine kinase dimerization/phosphoacceptor domain -containing protein [Methanomicrobium sp. W14]MBP2133248.1 PAS domain S-box-containing protein [Methanomicrobium sp. W14]
MSRQIEESKRELARVMELLKEEPRGLSITDISRLLNMNRNSVSKYLNMLLISGHVDMRSIGVAKVYFLSHRVPISAMLDFSSDAILVLNADQRIVQVNDNFLLFTGYDRDDIMGVRLPDSSLPVVSNAVVLRSITELLRGSADAKEIEWEDDQGKYFFMVKLIPTVFDDGSPGITIILEDITEVRKALKDKERLIDEIHLRVRNNLQTISSLLRIQAAGIEDPSIKDVMNEADRRILALSLVHKNLHQSSDQQHVIASGYIENLVEDLRKSMDVPAGIRVIVDAGDVLIPFEVAVPFGLLINELLTNVFKHAFSGKNEGVVRISLVKIGEDSFTLNFSDNGKGLPEGFDPYTTNSLGMSLIRNLIERQMSGNMNVKSGKGTHFDIKFRADGI